MKASTNPITLSSCPSPYLQVKGIQPGFKHLETYPSS